LLGVEREEERGRYGGFGETKGRKRFCRKETERCLLLGVLGGLLGLLFLDGLDATLLLGLELVVEEEEGLLVVPARPGKVVSTEREIGRGDTHSGRPEMMNMRSPVSS
jgi:hypothetical protein